MPGANAVPAQTRPLTANYISVDINASHWKLHQGDPDCVEAELQRFCPPLAHPYSFAGPVAGPLHPPLAVDHRGQRSAHQVLSARPLSARRSSNQPSGKHLAAKYLQHRIATYLRDVESI